MRRKVAARESRSLLIFWLAALFLVTPHAALTAAQSETDTIKVQYDASVHDSEREQFEDAIGLTSFRSTAGVPRTSKDAHAPFEYIIRAGTYAFWATIIGETKVAKVVSNQSPGMRLPSLAFDLGTAEVMRMPRVVQRVGHTNCIIVDPIRTPERAEDPSFIPCSFKVEGLVDKLSIHPAPDVLMMNYLSRRFEKEKGGHVDRLGGSLDYIDVKADHLHGEVIDSHQFWEKLYIYVVYVPVGPALRFHFILDGEYAPSGGNEQPSDGAFRSMQKEYATDFADYAKKLASDLQQCLERKHGYE